MSAALPCASHCGHRSPHRRWFHRRSRFQSNHVRIVKSLGCSQNRDRQHIRDQISECALYILTRIVPYRLMSQGTRWNGLSGTLIRQYGNRGCVSRNECCEVHARRANAHHRVYHRRFRVLLRQAISDCVSQRTPGPAKPLLNRTKALNSYLFTKVTFAIRTFDQVLLELPDAAETTRAMQTEQVGA